MSLLEEFSAIFNHYNLAQFLQWLCASLIPLIGSIVFGAIIFSKTNQFNIKEVRADIEKSSYYIKLFIKMLVLLNLILGGYCVWITYHSIKGFYFLFFLKYF